MCTEYLIAPLRRMATRRRRLGDYRPLTIRWDQMPKFEKHIFVCGNQRPPGNPRGCCDPSGQAKLQKLFKQKLAEHGLKGKVRANQSGCLDQCEHGPNVVVYPEAVWYGHVTEADVEEIVESHIIGGKPVRSLMLADSCLNTSTCEHRKIDNANRR
jgi:(2Fe-2S) ferredoxin